jgi:hypothetical protein
MEKRIIFFLSFFLAGAAYVFCAQPQQMPVTPSASAVAMPVTLSASPAALSVTPSASSVSITAGAVPVTPAVATAGYLPEELEQKFIEVKLKEVHFYVTPTFKFVLPDTSVVIGIKQDLGASTIEGMTEYNYIYSKMNYLLKYTLNVMFPPSLSLYDDVRFEQMYNSHKYLQRNRGVSASISTPKLFDFLTFREEAKNENFYFADLSGTFKIDSGTNLLSESWIETELKNGANERDFYVGLNFDKAIPSQFSIDDFLFINMNLFKRVQFNDEKISVFSELGYLLQNNNVPVWKQYTLGGFDHMIGYNVDEIIGFYKAFFRLRYDRLIADDINMRIFVPDLKSVDIFVDGDAGEAGDIWSMMHTMNYHTSVGIGTDITLTYKKTLKVKLTFAIAQAFVANRKPVFYFAWEI